jgi:hypothetical protein
MGGIDVQENNKMNLKEIWCEGVGRIHVAQDRVHWWALVNNHNLYVLPNIIRVIKPRKMRLAGHITQMDDMRNANSILIGKTK